MNKRIASIVEEVKPATLVVVTKTIDLAKTNELIAMGLKDIGENRVQTVREKWPGLDPSARLHFIGPLQRNKVKYLMGKCALIQSVHKVELMKTIEKEAAKAGIVQPILLQVNTAQEKQKQGFEIGDLEKAFELMDKLEHVEVQGLMMMAPRDADEKTLAKLFNQTKEVFDRYKANTYNKVYMKYLSMGMSNDYPIALACGANMVRIGRKIVGGIDE